MPQVEGKKSARPPSREGKRVLSNLPPARGVEAASNALAQPGDLDAGVGRRGHQSAVREAPAQSNSLMRTRGMSLCPRLREGVALADEGTGFAEDRRYSSSRGHLVTIKVKSKYWRRGRKGVKEGPAHRRDHLVYKRFVTWRVRLIPCKGEGDLIDRHPTAIWFSDRTYCGLVAISSG